MDKLHSITANLQYPEGIRREVFEGVEHLVVPVVMIVDGVLNSALVTQEEYGRYVQSWNGIPVPVLHPERDGIPISANSPDVIEKNTIGRIFNATTEGGKLKAEAWINTDKAGRLGYTDLVEELSAGRTIEVSTGYYSDSEESAGEYNGKEYTEIHRNIRPDHLALLPGEVGACSVQDGCGTRVNQRKGMIMKVNEAFTTLATALGLRDNCNCKESDMDLMKQAEELKNNGSLTAKQFQMITEMDDDAKAMLRALLDAMGSVEASADEEAEEMAEQSTETQEAQVATQSEKAADDQVKTFTAEDVETIVANQLRRAKVMDKLTANESCAFDEDDLKNMSIEALEKYEKSIRPADYSGAGGFATNSDAIDSNVTPLLPRSAFGKAKEA